MSKDKRQFKKILGVLTSALFCFVLTLSQCSVFGAFEAHIVNVTAQIDNDIPLLDPSGGQYCIDDILLGKFDIPDISGAYLCFTVGPGGETPVCGDSDNCAYGYKYDDETETFGIAKLMNRVKALTCHDTKQSRIMSWNFEFSEIYCNYECGNGMQEGSEECDDGNTADGDGCSANCTIEELLCDPEAELISNGGFEEPIVGTPQLWNIFISSIIPGWNIEWMSLEPSNYGGYDRPIDANIELHRGVNGWLSYEAQQYAELDSDWYGPGHSQSGEPASIKIYQEINTISGQNYEINFAFSPRPSTGADNNTLQLSIDEVVKDTISGIGSSNTVWSNNTYQFTASNSKTKIQFADLGTSDSLGTFLDAVSVRCVPPLPPAPVCGDGEVNQQSEQCDDGNTANGDGCSANCTIEEVQVNCPQGTTKEFVQTLTVDCKTGAKISSNPLIGSNPYILEARGTCNWRVEDSPNGYLADSEYWLRHDQYGEDWTKMNPGSIAFWDGSSPINIDWGAYTDTHIYPINYTPSTDGPATFYFYDDIYSDNSGSLEVKIYECKAPEVVCPQGTEPNLIETVNVDSSNFTGATSASVLTSGIQYLIKASGYWQNSLNVADTEYTSIDNWSTHMDGYDISPYLLGEGEFDLQIDGTFVNWGAYNPAHQYSYLYPGAGNPVNLAVFDGDSNTGTKNLGWYGDNNGIIAVQIYECGAPQ